MRNSSGESRLKPLMRKQVIHGDARRVLLSILPCRLVVALAAGDESPLPRALVDEIRDRYLGLATIERA
jgi:hypothetical protein